jgi:hypothetical protein
MSAFGMMVGAWSMLVQIVAPAPPVAPLEGAQSAERTIVVVDTTEGDNAPSVTLQSVTVMATFYTCQNVAANPMAPCALTRDGSDPATPGMACPLSWLGRVYQVEGFGALRCDDTGRHDYLYGLPHVDIRVPTYAAAVEHGIQERVIWRLE